MTPRQRLEMHAHHDKTILDLLRLCPEGIGSKSLLDVLAKWPTGSVSASLTRLSDQALIEARKCEDGCTRWFWVIPVAMRHRHAPRTA